MWTVSFVVLTLLAGSKLTDAFGVSATKPALKPPDFTAAPEVWPSPVTEAPLPMNAWVCFVSTVTVAAAPTPAPPPTATVATTLSSSVLSSAVIATVPSACTSPAPASEGAFGSSPTKARVVMLSTCTPAFTPTPALPPTAIPAATEVISSCELAPTAMSPSTCAVTPESMYALVCLMSESTSTPAATPAAPPMPTEPATETIEVVSDAVTVRFESPGVWASVCALAVAPAPMEAVVSSFSTRMVGATEMPAEPPTPPAALRAMMSSSDVALTVMPWLPAAFTALCAPMRAATVSLCTSVVLATPTPALLPPPIAPAIISAFMSPCAVSETLPCVAVSCTALPLPFSSV